MSDILIMGGGILGAMTAASFCAVGAKVTLVSGPQERASDGSLVWLNVSSAEDPDYAALRATSMGLWRALREAEAAPIAQKGALMWGGGVDVGRAVVRLSTLGWAARSVSSQDFAELAPGIDDAPDKALFLPDETACDPAAMMAWAGTRISGVVQVHGDVQSLTKTQGQVTGVQLTNGDTLRADHTIIAAGCGSPKLCASVGVDVPLRAAPGILLRTTPVPPVSDVVLASPYLDFWQDTDGRLIAATSWDQSLDQPPQEAAATALKILARMIPALGSPTIESLVVRNRPIPQDGLPLVGRIAEGASLAVTHSGMTLAPVIADTLTAQITGTPAAHDLSRYSPARLCTGIAGLTI